MNVWNKSFCECLKKKEERITKCKKIVFSLESSDSRDFF